MSTPIEQRRLPHRGAANDLAAFAPKFVHARLSGFEKDMRICLRGIPSKDRLGITHAYFPALTACCGMLEYLAALYVGRVDGVSYRDVAAYAKYLPQPDYDAEAIRVLFVAFRNTVAHRGIASGVWVDQHRATRGRRVTWKVHADARRPALVVANEGGTIKFDSPWLCAYTHRVHIHLGRLWRDIRDSTGGYLAELGSNAELQRNFSSCMKRLYPQ